VSSSREYLQAHIRETQALLQQALEDGECLRRPRGVTLCPEDDAFEDLRLTLAEFEDEQHAIQRWQDFLEDVLTRQQIALDLENQVAAHASAGRLRTLDFMRECSAQDSALDLRPLIPGTLQVVDFASLLLPPRLANEEIGDAMEVAGRIVHEGRSPWRASLVMLVSLFWAFWHAIRFGRR